jgi:hypothetical protein
MELLELLQHNLQIVFANAFKYLHDLWQWCIAQILAVPWERIGELPGSKVLLLVAGAGVVGYFLSKAIREVFAAGKKAYSALLTLLTVFAKTVPLILMAGLAAAAGAWVVNHVQL